MPDTISCVFDYQPHLLGERVELRPLRLRSRLDGAGRNSFVYELGR